MTLLYFSCISHERKLKMKRTVLKTVAVAMAIALLSVFTMIAVYADTEEGNSDDLPLLDAAPGQADEEDDADAPDADAPADTEPLQDKESDTETTDSSTSDPADDTTTASTTTEPVSDLSNIIGIVVAVIIAAAAIAAVIILAPKKTGTAKKK